MEKVAVLSTASEESEVTVLLLSFGGKPCPAGIRGKEFGEHNRIWDMLLAV